MSKAQIKAVSVLSKEKSKLNIKPVRNNKHISAVEITLNLTDITFITLYYPRTNYDCCGLFCNSKKEQIISGSNMLSVHQ